MRVIQAFQCNDGTVHLTPVVAAQHDFRKSLKALAGRKPVTAEFIVSNMDKVERLIAEAKRRDTSVELIGGDKPAPKLAAVAG